MGEREQRRPTIADSPDGNDPLSVFASELTDALDPPELRAVAKADDRADTPAFRLPRSTRPRRRPASALMGVAGLVGVAAGTLAFLVMTVGGSQSLRNRATLDSGEGSDTPALAGSAGQIAERELRPAATDVSARKREAPAAEPIQRPAAPRVERAPVRKAQTPAPETRAPRSTAGPAPSFTPAPVTPVRSAAPSAPPPQSGDTSVPVSAVPLTPTGGIATPSTAVRTAPPIADTESPSTTTAAPPAVVTRAPSSAVTAPPPSTVTAPAPRVVAPAPGIIAAAPSAVTAAPPSSATAQSAVRAVLERYAAAFSALDVRAAKVVWPRVNQDALTRAFSALEEQKFDLGSCDIQVTGANAVASCAGRVIYTPKVGNRNQRSEAREWTFHLDQDDQDWSIATVKSR